MIDWVFFDVGAVLFRDERQAFRAYEIHFEAIRALRPDYSFAEMLREREELAAQGTLWILRTLAGRHLDAGRIAALFKETQAKLDEEYDANHFVAPGAAEIIDELSPDFSLGIIANQSRECRRSLARRGLLERFKVAAISDEIGVSKPDVGIFRHALAESGANPGRCVMIGDRADNDVAPAASLGMKTVQLTWSAVAEQPWRPERAEEAAFMESLVRQPLFGASRQTIGPDRVAADLFGAARAVRELAHPAKPKGFSQT